MTTSVPVGSLSLAAGPSLPALLLLLLQVTERTHTPDPCLSPRPPCSLPVGAAPGVHDQVASDLPCYIMGWSRLSGTLALPLSLDVGVGRFLYHVSTS